MISIIPLIEGFLTLVQEIFYTMGSIPVVDLGGDLYISLLQIEIGVSFVAITMWGVHQLLSKSLAVQSG
jgi:hypothetical protein